MNEMKSIILRPSARTLAVYYGIAVCFSLAFLLFGLIAAFDPLERVAMSPLMCALGVIAGMVIAGFVALLHLEMKMSVYTITEAQGETRWGLLFKRNDFIQLGAIRSITVKQDPIQRLFKVGNLILHGTGNSVLVLWDVAQPGQRREEIWEMVVKAAPRSRSRSSSGR